jgi:hypothetical protein
VFLIGITINDIASNSKLPKRNKKKEGKGGRDRVQ